MGTVVSHYTILHKCGKRTHEFLGNFYFFSFSHTTGSHVKLTSAAWPLSLGGWAGKLAMADATKTTACPIGHMTYTQAPAVCEKKIFFLFHFTQPVKNYS